MVYDGVHWIYAELVGPLDGIYAFFTIFDAHSLMLVAEPLRKVRGRARHRHDPLAELDQASLHGLRADQLRAAVRRNLVTFPGQIPVFERHDRPDLQMRVVQLYFLLGWSCETIAVRYGMMRQRIGQVLSTWKRRAVETGYIQLIPPAEALHRPDRSIRIVLSPVVSSAEPGADIQDLQEVPVWAQANGMLIHSIKKTYGAGT